MVINLFLFLSFDLLTLADCDQVYSINDPLFDIVTMTDQKKDPLGKLRRKLSVQNHNHNRAQKNISKLRAIAKVGGIARGMFKRGSVSTKNAIKANRDKHLGRPGLYRSCRPVHAFDTDATVAITKSWGVSTSNSGDFVVVGEPKASTNWMNDICKFNLFNLFH